MNGLNGARVELSKLDKKTIFIRLPREAWRPIEGCRCVCPTCLANEATVSYWDTLAVSPDCANAWTVHKPVLGEP